MRTFVVVALLCALVCARTADATIQVSYPPDHQTKSNLTEYFPGGTTLNCSSGPFNNIYVTTSIEADPLLQPTPPAPTPPAATPSPAYRVVGEPPFQQIDGRNTLTLVANGGTDGKTCDIRGEIVQSGLTNVYVSRGSDTTHTTLLKSGIRVYGPAYFRSDVAYIDSPGIQAWHKGWVEIQHDYGVTYVSGQLICFYGGRMTLNGLVWVRPRVANGILTASMWFEDDCHLNAEGLGWGNNATDHPAGFPDGGWLDPASSAQAAVAPGRTQYIAPQWGDASVGLLISVPSGVGMNGQVWIGSDVRARVGTRYAQRFYKYIREDGSGGGSQIDFAEGGSIWMSLHAKSQGTINVNHGARLSLTTSDDTWPWFAYSDTMSQVVQESAGFGFRMRAGFVGSQRP